MKPPSLEAPDALMAKVLAQIEQSGGALPFDVFMALALYSPQGGYYARGDQQFGALSGIKGRTDFITAPVLSPHFGRALGAQVQQVLEAVHSVGGRPDITEFGAGQGHLMLQILEHQSECLRWQTANKTSKNQGQSCIVELSAALQERQRQTLHAHGVEWLTQWPQHVEGVVLGNEVLDAMPCKLLARVQGVWHERCVGFDGQGLVWVDRPTHLRPPLEPEGEHDYLTEIHPQAEAFVASLGARMRHCAAIFIDYGLPESEYYHPQRHMGTVMCHRAQASDTDPLRDVGDKDISTHINFTGIALAAQNAGLDVIGYTSQGRFLLNCGLLQALEGASLVERANAQKLMTEHEMGELFKVLMVCTPDLSAALAHAMGFCVGDRTPTL